MRLGELTYLTDQIVTFGFSSLELRNKAPDGFASFAGQTKKVGM